MAPTASGDRKNMAVLYYAFVAADANCKNKEIVL
jgi:hypothetical protein